MVMVLIRVMGFRFKATLVYGLLLVIVGFLLSFTWTDLFHYLLSKELQLKEGSIRWQNWKETPVPMYIDIYFFNWTNPKMIRKEKPHLVQVGPYRFHERRTKVDVSWNDNNTVSFRQIRRWMFDSEASVGTLKDNITSVNAIALTVAYSKRFQTYFEQKSVSFTLLTLRERIEVTKTVGEFLFDGYQNDLLTLANHLPESMKNGARTTDRFGWFYQRNGSSEQDGYYNIETGEGDLSQIGRVRQWNHGNSTHFMGPQCPLPVTGHTGELWQPNLPKGSTISIFSPDSCRTMDLDYRGGIEVEGVEGLLFSGGEDMFSERGGCSPSAPRGLLNLTACRWGAPLFLSYPHFLHADPKVQQGVDGLSPDPAIHSFDLAVEPNYGIPLSFKARFQVNMLLSKLDTYRIYSDIPAETYIPVMWIDQRAYITSSQGWQLWSLINLPAGGILFGAALVVIGAALIVIDQRPRHHLHVLPVSIINL